MLLVIVTLVEPVCHHLVPVYRDRCKREIPIDLVVTLSVPVLPWWHSCEDVYAIPLHISLPLVTPVIHRYLLKCKLLCFKMVITLLREGYKLKEAFSDARWLAQHAFKPSHSLQFSVQDVDHCLGSSTPFVEEQIMF